MADRVAEPRVSVLVPCYNVEGYLEQCLDSLAAQTLEDIEFICINDGSTDSTPDIIARYVEKDARFRQIDKPNSGYGASMNRGLSEARGRYIGILESDDFCEPETFEYLAAIAEMRDARAVKANFFFYWSKPEPRDELNRLVREDMPEVVDPKSFPELFWFMPSIWSAIYERSFLEENGIRFLETPGASYQDLSFTFKAWACADRVALVPWAFVHYRQDNEGSSIHSPGKVFCVCDEFAEMESFLDAHPELDMLWPVETRLKNDSYIWNYWRLGPELRSQFIGRYHDDMKRAERAGRIDYSMYLPWAELDLRQVLDDPAGFHRWARNRADGSQGHVAALARYFKVGGLPLVKKRLDYKG